MQTRLGPSTGVVALLLFAALVVALVVWTSIRPGRNANGAAFEQLGAAAAAAGLSAPAGDQAVLAADGNGSQTDQAVVADQPAAVTAGGAANSAQLPLPDRLVVRSYDPEGDGVENDDLLALALADQNPATNWMTVCYADRYAGKAGVGLVADLPAHGGGQLRFDVGTAPFTIDVFHVTDGVVPPTIEGWGNSDRRLHDTATGSHVVDVPGGATNVLLLFREIGTDPGCSQFTYRGQLGELAFTPR